MFTCQKKVSPLITSDELNLFSEPLSDAFTGEWVRIGRLQTVDYQPNAWLCENTGTTNQKTLQFKNNYTYLFNQIDCSTCEMFYLKDTLFLLYKKCIYKFLVMAFTDSSLFLQTNIGIPQYSLPNTGLFVCGLEEQYKKLK